MMTVWKDLPETETNHEIHEIYKACNQSAFVMPTIPKSDLFSSQQMSGNQTRHDAWIYELEPADYTVMICAYPQQVSLTRIGSIFEIIIFRKKLMSREDFSFIALQRMSMLHHSNNQTRNQFINLCKAKIRNKIVRNTITCTVR